MALVGLCAVLLGVWRFRRDNDSVERSLTRINLRALDGGDAAERRHAVEDLSVVRADDLAVAVTALAGALGDRDWQVRRAAARSLSSAIVRCVDARSGAVDDETRLAVNSLLQALADPQADVRLEAVKALGDLHDTITLRPNRRRPSMGVSIGMKDGRAVGPLIGAMRDPDPRIRAAAVRSLARVALATGAAPEPVLKVFVDDPDPSVRAAAAGALVTGWSDPDLLYPLLLSRLSAATTREELSAIGWALGGKLPAPPSQTLPALIDALERDDVILNQTIPIALALRKPARDFVSQQAASVLAVYGPAAAPVLPALREALHSDAAEIQERAAFVLGSMGPAALPARKDLSALMGMESDARVRFAAGNALKRIPAE